MVVLHCYYPHGEGLITRLITIAHKNQRLRPQAQALGERVWTHSRTSHQPVTRRMATSRRRMCAASAPETASWQPKSDRRHEDERSRKSKQGSKAERSSLIKGVEYLGKQDTAKLQNDIGQKSDLHMMSFRLFVVSL